MEKNQFINLVVEIATEVASRVYDERINGSLFIQDPQPEEVEEKKPRIRPYRIRQNTTQICLGGVARHYGQRIRDIDKMCEDIGIQSFVAKKNRCVSREDLELLIKVIGKKYNNFNEE